MEQRTKAWHDLRKSRIGASDAPIIMRAHTWTTPYQLWLEKMGLSSRRQTAAMEHGIQMEPIALKLFNAKTCREMQPEVFYNDSADCELRRIR